MNIRLCLAVLAAGWSGAAAASAAQPDPRVEALALLPKESIAFINIPSLAALETDLKRFSRETGVEIGKGDHPALDLLVRRTGVNVGVDPAGCACIGFLDPKKFRERYTVYVLPVADWDALLKAAAGEEMTPGLYALTGTVGPRFVARRGKFALVTSSIRTMDALADAAPLAPALSAETAARAAAGPMVYLKVHELTQIYEREIGSWFRAASGQVYNEPEAVPYADMLVTYMLGIADLLDQVETAEGAVRFGPDGLAVDLSVRFVEGAGAARFLSAQVPGTTPLPAVTDRPLVSEATVALDPGSRSDLLMRATRFFLDTAPRPEPLPEPTKKSVFEAVQVFADSLGEHMTFLSAPAAPGLGLEAQATVLDLKDPKEFRHGLDLMVAAWESLADQLNLYLRFQAAPQVTEVEGVEVVSYLPRLRFGIPARHVEFRERLKAMYGPEGLVYRVAIIGNRAVVTVGSDLGLFKQAISRLKGGKEPEPSPEVRRLETHLPAGQNLFIAMSLPMYLGQSLTRGGTPADKIGSIDPGRELVGVGVQGGKAMVQVRTYWPHEQIRLARELMNRVAPEMAEGAKSLFEPAPEGPPKPGPARPETTIPAPLLGPGVRIPPPPERRPMPEKPPAEKPAAEKPAP